MTSSIPNPGEALPHYVSTAPFDPSLIEPNTSGMAAFSKASQLRLMWWQFRQHKIAVWSGAFLVVLYLSILISEFLAPYNLHTRNIEHIYAPPQAIHLFNDGKFVGPFVYGREMTLDMDNLRRVYRDVPTDIQPLRFFCKGDTYHFWGLFEGRTHLVCPAEGGEMFLLGTDRLGRDVLSRIIYGARISLTIGLLGVAMSFVLGIVIGGLAGYRGGTFDLIVQRIIEVLQSIPSIPLWLALAAIMPVTWSPILVYLGITIILGMLDWTGLARAVRSKLLALRERRLCFVCTIDGRGHAAHHRQTPYSRLHVTPDRLCHIDDSRHDPGRDRTELSRAWSQTTDHKLGNSAHGGAQRQRHCAISVASHTDDPGRSRHSGL